MKILLFSQKITSILLVFESHSLHTTVFVRCKCFQAEKKNALKEDFNIFFGCTHFLNFHSPDSSVISLLIFSFGLEETAKPGKRCLLMYCYHCCSDSFSHTLCERAISQMEIWGQKAFLMFDEIAQLFEKQRVFHHKTLRFFTRVIHFSGFRIQSSVTFSIFKWIVVVHFFHPGLCTCSKPVLFGHFHIHGGPVPCSCIGFIFLQKQNTRL